MKRSAGGWRAPHSRVLAENSLLLGAYRASVPVTVHVAVGTDTPHTHPVADGAAIGAASHRDFRLFCSCVADLDGGGVYLNMGSAVLLPEVFLKAVSAVRNLGHPLARFTTANFDFLQHYRPRVNVVERPHAQIRRVPPNWGQMLAAAMESVAAEPNRKRFHSRCGSNRLHAPVRSNQSSLPLSSVKQPGQFHPLHPPPKNFSTLFVKYFTESLVASLTETQIASLFDITKSQAKEWLTKLINEGTVEKIRKTKPVQYQVSTTSDRLL